MRRFSDISRTLATLGVLLCSCVLQPVESIAQSHDIVALPSQPSDFGLDPTTTSIRYVITDGSGYALVEATNGNLKTFFTVSVPSGAIHQLAPARTFDETRDSVILISGPRLLLVSHTATQGIVLHFTTEGGEWKDLIPSASDGIYQGPYFAGIDTSDRVYLSAFKIPGSNMSASGDFSYIRVDSTGSIEYLFAGELGPVPLLDPTGVAFFLYHYANNGLDTAITPVSIGERGTAIQLFGDTPTAVRGNRLAVEKYNTRLLEVGTITPTEYIADARTKIYDSPGGAVFDGQGLFYGGRDEDIGVQPFAINQNGKLFDPLCEYPETTVRKVSSGIVGSLQSGAVIDVSSVNLQGDELSKGWAAIIPTSATAGRNYCSKLSIVPLGSCRGKFENQGIGELLASESLPRDCQFSLKLKKSNGGIVPARFLVHHVEAPSNNKAKITLRNVRGEGILTLANVERLYGLTISAKPRTKSLHSRTKRINIR